MCLISCSSVEYSCRFLTIVYPRTRTQCTHVAIRTSAVGFTRHNWTRSLIWYGTSFVAQSLSLCRATFVVDMIFQTSLQLKKHLVRRLIYIGRGRLLRSLTTRPRRSWYFVVTLTLLRHWMRDNAVRQPIWCCSFVLVWLHDKIKYNRHQRDWLQVSACTNDDTYRTIFSLRTHVGC